MLTLDGRIAAVVVVAVAAILLVLTFSVIRQI